jgi:hypothetical protein
MESEKVNYRKNQAQHLKRKRSRSRSEEPNLQKKEEIWNNSQNKSFNSKLFSKAMENVAISYLKKSDKKYSYK